MQRSTLMRAATLATAMTVAAFATACGSSSKSSSDSGTTTTVASTSAELTVTAGDYAYQGLPDTIPAGIVAVKFVNKGQVDHEMSFIKVSDGTTPKAVFAALTSIFQGGPFPASLLAANGVPTTHAGQTSDTRFNLTPGQYVIVCTETGTVGSTKDGPPHFSRGMYKTVTVTGTGGDVTPTANTALVAHDYGFDVSGLKVGPQTIVFKNIGPAQFHFAQILAFPKGTTVSAAAAAVPKLLAAAGSAAPRRAGPRRDCGVASRQSRKRKHILGGP